VDSQKRGGDSGYWVVTNGTPPLSQRCIFMHAPTHLPGSQFETGRPTPIALRRWWDIAVGVKREMTSDNVSIIAAGLALYALLAAFPALAAAVSIYGLFASPADVAEHMRQVAAMLPEDGARILESQVHDLSRREETLSIGVIVGIFLALWSARKGMVALIAATNVAYDEEEKRGFFKQLFVSLAFTTGAVFGFLAVLLLGVVVPIGLSFLPLGSAAETVLLVARWVILLAVAIVGLAIVYRFAPDRTDARWQWITPGSLIAAALWLAGSLLFALYVRNWASYGDTYGALGGVIALLMWFYLSGYVVILGAEINAEMERQARGDATPGAPQPRGQRGAFSAATVSPSARQAKR
jgi:membrane protein